MPVQCHENLYFYRDVFDQDAVLASLDEFKEKNRDIELLIWDSIPINCRTNIHNLESLAFPYWNNDYSTWESSLKDNTHWSVALHSDVTISTIRIYPGFVSDILTINYLSTEFSYRNRGIARAVIQNCINHVFKNTDCTSIQAQDISSPGAAKVLEKLGFVRNRLNIAIMRSVQELNETCKI